MEILLHAIHWAVVTLSYISEGKNRFDSILHTQTRLHGISISAHLRTGQTSGRAKTIPSHSRGTECENDPKNKTNLDKSLWKWLTELTNCFQNGTNFKQGLTVSWWVGISSSNCSCWEIFPRTLHALITCSLLRLFHQNFKCFLFEDSKKEDFFS